MPTRSARLRAPADFGLALQQARMAQGLSQTDLARELSRTAPLYLSFDGKATQGQGLIDGSDRSPRRHDKAPLARGLTAAGAFQAIARNCLVQIAANGAVFVMLAALALVFAAFATVVFSFIRRARRHAASQEGGVS